MVDRFTTLEIFVAVADHGSFVSAARTLRISPPAVTRGIAALEDRFGLALFHRSTRTVTLTSEGAGLLEKARQLLIDLGDVERLGQGTRSEPRGQLLITAPVVFGRLHVLPVITQLLAEHRDLNVEIMLIDRNVRIVEEGIDVAVRIGPLVDSALKAVTVGSVRQVIVASPTYLAHHGTPERPADLAQHDIIATTGPRAANEWRFGDKRETLIRVKPRLLTNSVDSAIAAAEAGSGIANFLSYQIDDALRARRLVELLGRERTKPLPVSLLFQASRSGLPAIRAFVAAMLSLKKNISSSPGF
jgi:DNA-binding transcriptional LysR family regulator